MLRGKLLLYVRATATTNIDNYVHQPTLASRARANYIVIHMCRQHASPEQLDVSTCQVVPFLLQQQMCGIAFQATLHRPRRCRCSTTGCRHTFSAAATKLFDFE